MSHGDTSINVDEMKKGQPKELFQAGHTYEELEGQRVRGLDRRVQSALDWHHDTVVHGEKTGRHPGDHFTLIVKEEDCLRLLEALKALHDKEALEEEL